MKRGSMEKKKLNINNILLDNKNPRLETIYKKQEEALKELINDSEEKIFQLILDIANNGLNPFENIGVLKEKENFIVLEGNRRICALKILNNPEIIKKINSKLYAKVLKLKTNISEIEVLIFNDRKSANEWIQLLHTGENFGKGRVSWKTHNKRLFDLRNSKPLTPAQQFLNSFYKKSKLADSLFNKLGDIKITNLERFLNDTNIKEALRIEKIKKGIFNFENIDIDIADKLMYDMILRKPTVYEVYKKEDRLEYLEKILKIEIPKEMISNKENIDRKDLYKTYDINEEKIVQKNVEINMENKKEVLTNIEKVNIENKNIENKRETLKNIGINIENKDRLEVKPKSNPHTLNRKTLIPMNVSLKIEDPKLNNLYKELKKCHLDQYPTLIECSFRIFLELTINEYASKHGIALNETKLEQKIKKVIDELFNKNLLSPSEKKNLFFMLDSNSAGSIKIQNSLVHTKLSLNPIVLKNVWDQYQNLFIILYDEINKKLAKQKKI